MFGTSRSGEGLPEDPFPMVQLELSSDKSVSQCVERVLNIAGRIDVLFNNAGFGVIGAIEETELDQARAQMDVFPQGIETLSSMIPSICPSTRILRKEIHPRGNILFYQDLLAEVRQFHYQEMDQYHRHCHSRTEQM